MSRSCVFCPATANLTAEHVFSGWMNRLVPGRKFFYNIRNPKQRWASEKLDWKARIVCATCNNTWMNDIEHRHAKPAMSDLIVGKLDVPITQARAHSIAMFAFKTALVLDHINPQRHLHFFSRQVRYRFRETLEIPENVTMWMAAFFDSSEGGFLANYPTGKLDDTVVVELYSCSYIVGHFIFQILAEKKPSGWLLHPTPGFENLAVGFWPTVPRGLHWPPKSVLKTAGDIRQFSYRWKAFTFTNLSGA